MEPVSFSGENTERDPFLEFLESQEREFSNLESINYVKEALTVYHNTVRVMRSERHYHVVPVSTTDFKPNLDAIYLTDHLP